MSRPPEGYPALSFPSQTELRPDTGVRGEEVLSFGGKNQALLLGGLGWGQRGHCCVI